MATSEAETLVETAGAIMQAEIDDAREHVANVIEHASEQIDAANERAEEIARAAMETEIGRRVGALETRGYEWQEALDGLRRDLTSLMEQLSNLQSAVAATATLVVATELAEPAPSSSIPQPSSNPATVEAAMDQVTEVIPDALSENTPAAPLEPVPPARKHRWM